MVDLQGALKLIDLIVRRRLGEIEVLQQSGLVPGHHRHAARADRAIVIQHGIGDELGPVPQRRIADDERFATVS